MGNPWLPVLLIAVAATGCRTTRDADADEIARLDSVEGTLWSSADARSDNGQSSLSLIAAIDAPLKALSEKPGQDSGLFPLREAEELDLIRQAVFLDAGRDEWPDCVTETDTGATYANCELGASGGGASVNFGVDGSYHWTDNSSDADLTIDFNVSASSVGVGSVFNWNHDLDWTDTVLDGDFGMDWALGVSLGGLPTLGQASFTLNATLDQLTGDGVCEGPVSGILDWRATTREGTDPPENTHVTVEWLACGEALITQ